jgi:hypothetical protein
VAEGLPFVSVNVLSEEKKQQVIALGRLGWSLRRIERETKVRRETAAAYLKAAGISVRLPGAWGRRPPPKPANQVSPDSARADSKPANEASPDSAPVGEPTRSPTASTCEPFFDFIELSLSRGRNAKATKRGLFGAKRKTLCGVADYLHCNRARMHYDEYLANGWPIASGPVEGACKNLIKDRMERSGMRWTETMAEAVVQLRAIYLSGDFDRYWSFHIEKDQQRLHPGHWTVVLK